MFININYHSGLPIYRQIMNQIKYMVSTEELKPEEKLPSVRELASTLKVNPTSVVRAYRDLEHEGVIYTRRGSGTFVSSDANKLARSVKIKTINELIKSLLAEAYQMGLSKDEITALFQERIKKIGE